MKKFPVICPPGAIVMICQWFKPANNPSHDAVDFIIRNPNLSDRENARLTYGAQLVCPVSKAQGVLLNDFGTMQELGNGVDIEWKDGGFYYRLHFWHNVFNTVKLNDIVSEGQIVGLMGNTGAVKPAPTPERPYDGTHCHMRYSQYQKDNWGGNINIVSLDPCLYFDVNNPYQGKDSDVLVDLEPINWSFGRLNIKDNFNKLCYFIRNIFN